MIATSTLDPEFDEVFTLAPSAEGVTYTEERSIYAPSVYHSESADIEIDGSEWKALTGRTGQYGYNGAVMHSSEMFSGPLVASLIEEVEESGEPMTLAVVLVNVVDCDGECGDECDGYHEPAGWAVVRKVK